MPQYPEPIVRALLIRPNKRFLLVRSHKWKHHWVLPGGHIEQGENVEDALHREVDEETGLQITKHRFLGYQNVIHSPHFHTQAHFIFLDFICDTPGERVVLNHEAQAWRWCAQTDLRDMKVEPLTLKALERAQGNLSQT